MAARIPDEIIEEVMRRVDIVEIVGEYVPLKRRGRNWFGLCPFHNEDTASFSVNQEKQIYKCFGCGKGGNVIGFLQEIDHLTFNEAVRKLAERSGVTIPEKKLSPAEQKNAAERQSMLAAHAAAAEFYSAMLESSVGAQSYMKKRQISPQTAARFRLGAADEHNWQALYNHLHQAGYSDEMMIKCGLISKSTKNGRCYDKFHGRLIFPIRDPHGTVVAFGGRAILNEEPKYLNSQTTPIYNKSNLLYALDLAGNSIREQRQAVIMEGYMDVLTAHSCGITNAVASLGTAFTSEHARLLSRFAPEEGRLQVILAFDGDAAGQKAARMSLDKLSGYEFIEPLVAVFPDKLDPDDFLKKYGERGWQRILEKYCYPRLDYLFLRALEKYGTSTAAEKGAVVQEMIPALHTTKNATERDSFIDQMAKQLRVSEDSIRTDLSGSVAKSPASTSASVAVYREKIYRTGEAANRQLLILALADKKIFQRAVAELGPLFPSTEEESQLIDFIINLDEKYNFHPSSLFNYIDNENEGLRDFLLKLLQADIVTENADDLLRIIQQQELNRRINLLQQQISAAQKNNEPTDQLVAEKTRLTLEKIKLGQLPT